MPFHLIKRVVVWTPTSMSGGASARQRPGKAWLGGAVPGKSCTARSAVEPRPAAAPKTAALTERPVSTELAAKCKALYADRINESRYSELIGLPDSGGWQERTPTQILSCDPLETQVSCSLILCSILMGDTSSFQVRRSASR